MTLAGPWGIKVSIPIARLPLTIGSDKDLFSNQSVYPTIHGLAVPIVPFRFSSAAGALASQQAITTTILQDFSTRLGATFDEYCITGAVLEVRAIMRSGTAQGIVIIYLDEKDSTTPTAAAANAAPHIELSVNNEALPMRHRIEWLARDLVDLEWTSTSSLTTPCYVKGFTSQTVGFTAPDTVVDVIFTGALNLDVRGWKTA